MSFFRYQPDKERHKNLNGKPVYYYADRDLVIAVNTALAAAQPLLITGDPGCGKTTLAESVAAELELGEVLEFHTHSDSLAKDALYRFDNLGRLHDVQESANLPKALLPKTEFRQWGALGRAIKDAHAASDSPQQKVVLIDEIDKASSDFPNGLLDQIDKMRVEVPETGEHYTARSDKRPIVIITSNSERQLPQPFLRRCCFHHISFPSDKDVLRDILHWHTGAGVELQIAAVDRFLGLRDKRLGLARKPATGELIVWVMALMAYQEDVGARELHRLLKSETEGNLPCLGALIKGRGDMDLLKPKGPRPQG